MSRWDLAQVSDVGFFATCDASVDIGWVCNSYGDYTFNCTSHALEARWDIFFNNGLFACRITMYTLSCEILQSSRGLSDTTEYRCATLGFL